MRGLGLTVPGPPFSSGPPGPGLLVRLTWARPSHGSRSSGSRRGLFEFVPNADRVSSASVGPPHSSMDLAIRGRWLSRAAPSKHSAADTFRPAPASNEPLPSVVLLGPAGPGRGAARIRLRLPPPASPPRLPLRRATLRAMGSSLRTPPAFVGRDLPAACPEQVSWVWSHPATDGTARTRPIPRGSPAPPPALLPRSVSPRPFRVLALAAGLPAQPSTPPGFRLGCGCPVRAAVAFFRASPTRTRARFASSRSAHPRAVLLPELPPMRHIRVCDCHPFLAVPGLRAGPHQ
jgi:hypothetical protein